MYPLSKEANDLGGVEGPKYRNLPSIDWVKSGGPKFIGEIGTVQVRDACSDEMDRMRQNGNI